MRSVVHDQKGGVIFHAKVEHPHDVGMDELDKGARLGKKTFQVILGQSRMHHFNGGLAFEIDMLPQVYFGKASLSQEAHEAIVAKLLAHAVGHRYFSLCVGALDVQTTACQRDTNLDHKYRYALAHRCTNYTIQ